MVEKLRYSVLLAVLLCLLSCGKDYPEKGRATLIRFSPEVEATVKSMIDNDADLRKACTPVADGGEGKAIAVWADMVDAKNKETRDVFNGVNLRWQERTDGGGHEDNPSDDETANRSKWNTFDAEGHPGDVAWRQDETYYFRAYYPAGIELKGNTSARVFIAEYNTEVLQEDLMTAYTKVETTTSNLGSHVPLKFRHMLSAVQFTYCFKYDFEASDKLTSMWIENTKGAGSFTDYGFIACGDGTDTDTGMEKIRWYDVYSPQGVKMYEWKAEGDGIPFDNKGTIATAYQANAAGDTGHIFTDSGNYIYVIPQQIKPGTRICFTTAGGGDSVFSVDFPTTFTGPTGASTDEFEAGYRYKFDLVITKLSIDVLITIKPWNELTSSYTIEF